MVFDAQQTCTLDLLHPLAYAKHMSQGQSNNTVAVRHARLFRNGRNQAVRIPREFEFSADEVIIYKEDHRLVVEPVRRTLSLAEVLPKLAPLQERFPRIDDPPSEPEDLL